MPYTDKHGRHELVLSLEISRGDADYRVVSTPETARSAAGEETEPRRTKTRRAMSPIRAAAAAQLAAERNQQQQ